MKVFVKSTERLKTIQNYRFNRLSVAVVTTEKKIHQDCIQTALQRSKLSTHFNVVTPISVRPKGQLLKHLMNLSQLETPKNKQVGGGGTFPGVRS